MKPTKTTHEQEITAKRLLRVEVVICVTSAIVLAMSIVFAVIAPMLDWQKITLLIIGIVQFLIVVCCALSIEQNVGYYHCGKCGYDYVPTYGKVLWAFHFGRTRYLKCSKCDQRSWQKKKLVKNK